MTQNTVVVTGASSQIGYFLLPRIESTGDTVTAIARTRPYWAGRTSIQWRLMDLNSGWPQDVRGAVLIHAAPLPLLAGIIPAAAGAGVQRLIAFSSMSVKVKADTIYASERRQAAQLRDAEAKLINACGKAGIAWTIFRPTLIYGAGLDSNISALAAFIQRFGFVPLPGRADGLRQPVHADDLASACIAVLDCAAAAGRTYELGGAATLTYRQMVEQVFYALGREPRVIHLPAPLCRAGLKLLHLLPRYRQLPPGLVDRLERDQTVDFSQARADFGFQPRTFCPDQTELRAPN